MSLAVECDTTNYPQMFFTTESTEGEWETSAFLTTDNFEKEGLWMFNKSESTTFTAWNVLLDGTTKLAPIISDSYYLSPISGDVQDLTVDFSSKYMISWPIESQLENTAVQSNVLFLEDSEGNITAYRPQKSVCGDLRMIQNYINGDFVLQCTSH